MINTVIIDGLVSHMALRYDTGGKPELRLTLVQPGEWPLYLPAYAIGATAEHLANELEDGQHIVVTSGKLAYRKRTTKAGEVSRLEVLMWSIEVLAASTGAEHEELRPYSSDGAGEIVEPGATSARKPYRPRYPKAALQGGFSK